MRKLVLSALAQAFVTAAVAAVHVVGGGTPNSHNTFPFYGGYPAFRWQTMWFQKELNETGPLIKIEWQIYDRAGGSGGTYKNCDVLLCHTGISAITSTFANNYGGNKAVNVFSGTYVLPASSVNQWITVVEPENFTYNNRDNLLIEVSWQGGSPGSNYFKVRTTGTPPFPGRVWNTTSKTAATGFTQAKYHQYGRITIGGAGVEATSLGRVKSLFR